MKTRHQTALNKALINAAAEGRSADFARLLRDGAQLDGVEQSGTPLIAATVNDQRAAIETLLALGARVNVADEQGQTALTHAINGRLSGVVQLLVQAGADLNVKDNTGNTALMRAAANHQQDIIDDLIALQADVNVTNTAGVSALMRAHSDKGIVRSLLDARADLSHAANKNALPDAVYSGKIEVAHMLLQAGAKIGVADWSSQPLLTHAAGQGNAGLVRSLIAANADPNHYLNQHALAHALASPNAEVLQALLDAGARPDLNSAPGQKAVIAAFERGNADAVARWFPACANTTNAAENTAWNPLPDAVAQAPAEITGILRDAGYSVNFISDRGYTLLMLASHLGRPSIVDSLLQPRNGAPGADPNVQDGRDGKTALMFAAVHGGIDAMQSLLAAGADPSAVDYAGHSVREYAGKCPSPGHWKTMDSMLLEAIVARALEFPALLRLAHDGCDDSLDMQDGDAFDNDSSANDFDQNAFTQWHDTMNDIDESPVLME